MTQIQQLDPYGRPLQPAPGASGHDPGSRRAAKMAWVGVAVLLTLVVVLNQCALKSSSPGAATTTAMADPFPILCRVLVKVAYWSGQEGEAKQVVESLRGQATTAHHKFQIAVVASDIGYTHAPRDLPEAERRAAATAVLEQELATIKLDEEGLGDDAAILRKVVAGSGVTGEEKDAFLKEHGWIGRLAFSIGAPESDAERRALTGGGGRVVAFLIAVAGMGLVVVVASIACFVVAATRLARRRTGRAFRAPAPGGSVHLETCAVFIAGFLLLQVAMSIVGSALGNDSSAALTAQLFAQWLLLPLIFWPLARGVPWREYKAQAGWHAGRGVAREMAAGLFAYLAGLPLVLLGILVTLVALMVKAGVQKAMGGNPEPPSNPIAEIIFSAKAYQLALLFVLASVWAPIVEETVFRGSLFRHLRSRVGLVLAAIGSALVFGLMHGYEILALSPVIALGFVFALMREWRGSLVAPVTAHAIHNACTLGILLTGLSLVRE